MRGDDGSEASDVESRLLREEEDEMACGETRVTDVDGFA